MEKEDKQGLLELLVGITPLIVALLLYALGYIECRACDITFGR